jgi:hypothetical protein
MPLFVNSVVSNGVNVPCTRVIIVKKSSKHHGDISGVNLRFWEASLLRFDDGL